MALGWRGCSLGPHPVPPTPRTGSPESNKELELYNRLFTNYDKSRWPAQRVGEVLQVFLRLTLTNLISLVGGPFSTPGGKGRPGGFKRIEEW